MELTVGVLEVLTMLKNLETPLGGSIGSPARTCKEIMLLNNSLPDGKTRSDSTTHAPEQLGAVYLEGKKS